MRIPVSGREMKALDRRSIEEFGIPSMVLMERAALGVAAEAYRMVTGEEPGNGSAKSPARKTADGGEGRELLQEAGCSGGRKDCLPVLAVCGFGNNGADGIAAARILHLWGIPVSILLPGGEGRKSPEFEAQLLTAQKLGIPVDTAEEFIPGRSSLILDALFGVGLSRPVTGTFLDLIRFINEQQAPVLSIDIPSGVSSDTGAVLGGAVKADVTVTFGEKKLGQALFPGRELSGRLVISDIGLVPEEEERRALHVRSLEPCDLDRIPKRKKNSNKGTFGKVLVMAGSAGMAGAAFFSALAAYRCGAGLVKIFTAAENRPVLQQKLPEAIVVSYEAEEAKADPQRWKELVKEQTAWADVIVLGPGIGTGAAAEMMVETVLSEAYVPLILDADAVNLLAKRPKLKEYLTENMILTPHMMEMSRFTGTGIGELKMDPVGYAGALSREYGVTCVLKDAATVISVRDGSLYVNESGSPAMAKGGSGDVLTGVIAGLIAIGMEEGEAAAMGVYVHGLAGEAAEKRYGIHSVLAGELADSLSEVMRHAD